MKRYLTYVFMLHIIILTGCGGGGGGGSTDGGGGGGGGNTPVALIPLNISIHDLAGNPIPYIDVYKNASHYKYKLTFSNPNSVTVTPPQSSFLNKPNGPDFGVDINWVSANNESAQPGVYTMLGTYTKTTNADDCLNSSSLAPGGSCSFYTTSFNVVNPTTQTEFKVPISYSILQTGLPTDKPNALAVWQCPPVDITNPASGYDCSNAKKPGFANQFIIYHLNPTPTLVPNPDLPRSADGRWVYTCGGMLGLNCNKYQVNYDSTTNTLTYAESPAYSFNLKRRLTPGDAFHPLQYISYNGSNSFYVGYDSTGIWSIFNSGSPSLDYDAVDLMLAQYNVYAVAGLDNSFWVQPDGGKQTASFYDPTSWRFTPTNFNMDNPSGAGVYAIAKDGTVISGNIHLVMCSRTTGSPTEYVSVPLKNYVQPNNNSGIVSMSSGIYVDMVLPDIVNYLGSTQYIHAWYKIHTENGLCELRPDDYMIASVRTYEDYSITYGTKGAYITQTSNVFTGL